MGEKGRNGVLIVEDEGELRNLFAVILEMENFRVYQASDAQSGLKVLDEHADSIDVLITDLGLPHMGGVELIAKVRSLKPSVKIIGTSGLGGGSVEAMVRNAGADAFLPKPFNPSDAIARVKEVIGRS
jgi:DNA-binding response OmpR family regulator